MPSARPTDTITTPRRYKRHERVELVDSIVRRARDPVHSAVLPIPPKCAGPILDEYDAADVLDRAADA
jgi:hypothetical protein